MKSIAIMFLVLSSSVVSAETLRCYTDHESNVTCSDGVTGKINENGVTTYSDGSQTYIENQNVKTDSNGITSYADEFGKNIYGDGRISYTDKRGHTIFRMEKIVTLMFMVK